MDMRVSITKSVLVHTERANQTGNNFFSHFVSFDSQLTNRDDPVASVEKVGYQVTERTSHNQIDGNHHPEVEKTLKNCVFPEN